MMGVDVPSLLAVILVACAIGGGMLMRHPHRGPVGGGEMQDFARRLDAMQISIAAMPAVERVTAVERGMAVVQADMASIKTAIERVDKMVTILVESKIEGDRRR